MCVCVYWFTCVYRTCVWLHSMHRAVTSPYELISLVKDGMKHRATHSTNIHEHSSRSHLIVTVQISGTCDGDGLVSVASSTSSLHLNATITPVTSTESTPLVSLFFSTTKCIILLRTLFVLDWLNYRTCAPSSTISKVSPINSPPRPRCKSRSNSSSAPNMALTAASVFSSGSSGSSRNSSPRYPHFYVKLQLVDLAGSECVGESHTFRKI